MTGMILYLHFGNPQPDPAYRRLLGMVGEFTPVAQALPPTRPSPTCPGAPAISTATPPGSRP
ncbi:hypothetical protein ACF08E_09185 [Streptomyces globisporus]|uniref:hypothetical protein n=1 Tax=Streptomyces globisporus TaxID=1908 RepID=UPI0036FA0F1E